LSVRDIVRRAFRYHRSTTEEDFILGAPEVFLEKQAAEVVDSETFRTYKRVAQKELGCNLMIDDEMFFALLDRVCYLEKKIK